MSSGMIKSSRRKCGNREKSKKRSRKSRIRNWEQGEEPDMKQEQN